MSSQRRFKAMFANAWLRCRQELATLAMLGFLLPSGGQAVDVQPFRCEIHQPEISLRNKLALNIAWTTGKKRLLFCRVRFKDTVENEPISKAEAEETLAETNRRFVRMSYGQFSLDYTITSLLQLDHDIAYYRDLGFAGLMFETQQAAAQAGYAPEGYDLEMVYTPQIPGFPAGQANIGQSGALVHQNFASTFVHELGHNLGLFHANSWDNAHAALGFHSTPPFPSNILEYQLPLIFNPASLMGNGDLRSPGRSVEYGDFFDTMGAGGGDYNSAFKARLLWLAPTQISQAHSNGVYRLYAHDQGTTSPDRLYALRIPRLVDGRGQNFTFRYWVSFRTLAPGEIHVPTGVQIHWIDQGESYTSQLLDLQPGTPQNAWDSALPLGRTHSDPEIGVHITPRQLGFEAGGAWIDVQIHLESPNTNHPPSVSLEAPSRRLQPEESVELVAAAEDPEGDQLAYYWNLGDGTFQGGSGRITKSWSKPGQYLVRCEVSDGKGGSTARQALINVGENRGLLIQGRVVSSQGIPVAGALVTNGRIEEEAGMLPDYAMTQTDANGVFILPGLTPGNYDVGAQAYGWTILRKESDGPIRVESQDILGLDFVATELPTVIASSAGSVREGDNLLITLKRSGDLKTELPVEFVVNGTAGQGQDYSGLSPARVTFPKGSESVTMSLQALEDLDEDPNEELLITLIPAGELRSSVPRRAESTEVINYYPGWEPQATAVGNLWFQTDPSFRRGAGSVASIRIVDTTPRGIQRVSVLNQFGLAYERPRSPVPVRISRIGSTEAPLDVHWSISGTAQNGIDYDAVPSNVTIPTGADFVEIMISPIPDDELEGDESVELTLLPSESYRLEGNSSIQLAIQEDEFHSGPNRVAFGFRWGGSVVIRLEGEAGKTYILEASTNLIDWTAVSTNIVDFSPIGIPIAPLTEAALFYRSRRQ